MTPQFITAAEARAITGHRTASAFCEFVRRHNLRAATTGAAPIRRFTGHYDRDSLTAAIRARVAAETPAAKVRTAIQRGRADARRGVRQ